MQYDVEVTPVAQPFRAALGAEGRPEGLRYRHAASRPPRFRVCR